MNNEWNVNVLQNSSLKIQHIFQQVFIDRNIPDNFFFEVALYFF